MAARVTTNAPQVKRRIQKYQDNVEKTALRRSFKKAGPLLVERAQQNAPIDEGTLRNSLDFTVRRRKGETILSLGSRSGEAPHVTPVELGTTHSVAQPFLVPSLQYERDDILDTVIGELNRLGREISRST